MNSHLIIKLTVLVFSYFLLLPDVVAQEEPSKLDIATAEYKLKGIERSAKLANGAPFSLGKDGTIALEKIAALYKAFPDHPKVKELFDRARTVVKASKGDFIEISILFHVIGLQKFVDILSADIMDIQSLNQSQ